MKYRNEIWLADLNPRIGAEAGKVRPVVIIQTDLLNEHGHTSTLVCPITTKVRKAPLVRVFLKEDTDGVLTDSEIMVDQIRAIDNSRFVKRLGRITKKQREILDESLKAMLDL